PVDEQPVDEQPVDEQPVDEQPVDEQPVDEAPADEAPADEQPVDEQPVYDEQPVDGTPMHEDVPSGPSAPGDLRVAAAVRRLEELGDSPPEEHVEVYEQVHRVLQETLGDAQQDRSDGG
ncbi:MAG TPA: hypothetical protein VK640_10470, partial [Actinomycetes bacterium]|nr:hypothetical protein [Actinomycetes bacterium]